MDDESRPDPQELLKAIYLEEERNQKGKLKIFLGMSAGVGKTFAMLEEAHRLLKIGVDVKVGVIETHGRKETEKLLEGLDVIPLKDISYRGLEFKELNIDKILEIKPKLVLIDELAHNNVPGSRHAKRWQDVVEIIEQGIDVFSALNIQHIESLKDHVENIAQISIRETVPDSIVEMAESIELIDLTPTELLERLKEGKVYLGDKSNIAANHFFKKDRLTALREMALRFAAEKVDHDLKGMETTGSRLFGWKTRERLLVAVSPREQSQKLIRTTRRIAFNLNAPWIALYVNTGALLSDDQKAMLNNNLSLARDLGAEVITTNDPNVAGAIQRISTQEGVTQIILGHPPVNKFLGLFYRPNLLDRLTKLCDDIDIHVIHQTETKVSTKFSLVSLFHGHLWPYLVSFCLITALALASLLLIEEKVYLIVLMVFLALLIGVIIDWARTQRKMLTQRESSAQTLYKISREIAIAPSAKLVLPLVEKELSKLLKGTCQIIIKEIEGGLNFKETEDLKEDPKEQAVATWVFENETEAGWSTSTLPSSRFIYLPLKGFTEVIGVLAFRSKNDKKLSIETKNLLYSTGFQIASHIERLFTEARELDIKGLYQKDKSYQSIVKLISRQLELQISNLNQALNNNSDKAEITEVASGLNRILENVSAITQFQSEINSATKGKFSVEEVLEASLENMKKLLVNHTIHSNVERDLPKLNFDFHLIEILISNLLSNAAIHSPPGSSIQIEAREEQGILIFSVIDSGKNTSQVLSTVFETFNRIPEADNSQLGMELSLVNTIAEIYGGVLIQSKHRSGGRQFALHIPLKK